MNLYRGSNLLRSFEVGLGKNKSDAQTVTQQKDGKVNWAGGNWSTGAGVYKLSNVNGKNKEYYNLPSFNLTNSRGIQISTSMHAALPERRRLFNNGNIADNRMSNGCINGRCQDIKDLYSKYHVNNGTSLYVLPEDEGNHFEIVDGKPILKVKASNRPKYNKYVDSEGVLQNGQGVNRGLNNSTYAPIQAIMNKGQFEKNVYQWNDLNDEDEYQNTTKPFYTALKNHKQAVMKAANVSSDVYNDLAKMSFGIYGTESNYGDTNSAAGNLVRAGRKFFSPKSSSSPDYQAKFNTYGANGPNRSVGLTQIRWSYLNTDERNALKQLGITSNKDFMDPQKAAIGTTAILGVRYNQQLTEEQRKDMWKYLPSKWNVRGNYGDRVKQNSQYLTIKQETGGAIAVSGSSMPRTAEERFKKLGKAAKQVNLKRIGELTKRQFGGVMQTHHMAPPKKPDTLEPHKIDDEDHGYTKWLTTLPDRLKQGADYDLKGYFSKYGPVHVLGDQHLTDEYKRPNHVTFSKESVYNSPEKEGGEWRKATDGKWEFVASKWNLENVGLDSLQSYFKQNEPGSRLVLPPTKHEEGGAINVIATGAFHSRKHNILTNGDMSDDARITLKGIPVVSDTEDGFTQHAEVEHNELILHYDLTKELEELFEDGSDESACKAGKLLAREIVKNTKDSSSKLLKK